MTTGNGNGEGRFTGHGAEWTDANLSEKDAHVATVWVEPIWGGVLFAVAAALGLKLTVSR